MQRIYTNTVALGATAALASNVPPRAAKIQAEPLATNTHASNVTDASGNVIRQFPGSGLPVAFPFAHHTEGNNIVPGSFGFTGTAGDSMLVTFWED